jgi:hypothetical protein
LVAGTSPATSPSGDGFGRVRRRGHGELTRIGRGGEGRGGAHSGGSRCMPARGRLEWPESPELAGDRDERGRRRLLVPVPPSFGSWTRTMQSRPAHTPDRVASPLVAGGREGSGRTAAGALGSAGSERGSEGESKRGEGGKAGELRGKRGEALLSSPTCSVAVAGGERQRSSARGAA